MQVLASQLHFLANRNAGLAIPPLFWPVHCIKIKGHVALLSGPTVYSLYYTKTCKGFDCIFVVAGQCEDERGHMGNNGYSMANDESLGNAKVIGVG